MDAFEQIKTIPLTQVLSALGVKFMKQGKQIYLMEGEKTTDGWRGDEETGFVKDFSGKRAEGDRITFVQHHLGFSSKAQVVEWYKTAFGIKSDDFKDLAPSAPVTAKPKMQPHGTEVPKEAREKIFDKWESLPELNEAQREYVKSRGVDPDLVAKYAKNNAGMISVRIFDEEGILTLQNRSITEKRFMIEPGTASKGCFMSDINVDVKKVFVVEGMFDFLTMAQFGVNVLGMKSATDGGSLVRAFATKGYEVTIVPDTDEPGRKMRESFEDVPHFWVDISDLGIKDFNEMVVKSEWSKDQIMTYLEEYRTIAGPLPPKRPYEIIDYKSSLEDGIDELNSTKIENVISWGVGQLDSQLGYLMPGQLVLVGGLTGSGKSTFVNEISGNVSKQGIRVGRFVLEDRHQDKRKEDLYFEIGKIRKARGEKNYPKSEFMANAIRDKMTFSKDLSDAKSNLVAKYSNILDVKANTQERMKIDDLGWLVKDFVSKGCKLIVIDHLHYFKIVGDAQRYDLLVENAMQYINAIARDYGVTILLVAHYKKLGGAKPDDESFKDSMAISQVPNKVIHVHRDKMSQDKGFTELIVTKNREGWTGTIEMNFDTDTNTYSNKKSELQSEREKKANSLSLM